MITLVMAPMVVMMDRVDELLHQHGGPTPDPNGAESWLVMAIIK